MLKKIGLTLIISEGLKHIYFSKRYLLSNFAGTSSITHCFVYESSIVGS